MFVWLSAPRRPPLPHHLDHEPAPDELDGASMARERARGLDPALAAIVVLRDVERLSPEDVQLVLDLQPADQHELLAYGRARVWEALG